LRELIAPPCNANERIRSTRAAEITCCRCVCLSTAAAAAFSLASESCVASMAGAVPGAFVSLRPVEPPSGNFSAHDLTVEQVQYFGEHGVAALLLNEPTTAAAEALIARLQAGEQRRAGCAILRASEAKRESQVELSVVLRCEHGDRRKGRQQRGSMLGVDPSARTAADSDTVSEARPRATKRARRSHSPSAAPERASVGDAQAAPRCAYQLKIKQWPDQMGVLYVQLVHPEHVDADGANVHPLSSRCCDAVRDRCAQGHVAQDILQGAPPARALRASSCQGQNDARVPYRAAAARCLCLHSAEALFRGAMAGIGGTPHAMRTRSSQS
jgi:hypothetical protein